jgi:hypothetical protein
MGSLGSSGVLFLPPFKKFSGGELTTSIVSSLSNAVDHDDNDL